MAKLTAKKIAEELNISPSTVSKVLNNKENISEKTKQIVFDYIENNTPLFNHSMTVGVVVNNLNIEVYAQIISNLQKSLLKNNINVILMTTNYSYDEERSSFLSLIKNQVKCIIAIGTRYSSIYKDELHEIPIITMTHTNPIIDGEIYESIHSEEYIGSLLACEELITKGCKRIAFFTNAVILDEENNDRYRGYIDTLNKYNLLIDRNLIINSGTFSNNSIEDARMMVDYLLAKNIQFDGLFATSDRRALGALLSLQEHQIKCPEEVKVIGYDASSLSVSFHITSISQDGITISNNILYVILKLLNLNTEYLDFKNPSPVFLIRGKTT